MRVHCIPPLYSKMKIALALSVKINFFTPELTQFLKSEELKRHLVMTELMN